MSEIADARMISCGRAVDKIKAETHTSSDKANTAALPNFVFANCREIAPQPAQQHTPAHNTQMPKTGVFQNPSAKSFIDHSLNGSMFLAR